LIVVDVDDVITVYVRSGRLVPEFGSAESVIEDEELICSGSICEDLEQYK